jgi:hypothetical protein
LGIRLDRDSIKSRTSRNPKPGEVLLQGVRDESHNLCYYITNHIYFMQIIYAMREPVVHREILPSSDFGDFIVSIVGWDKADLFAITMKKFTEDRPGF